LDKMNDGKEGRRYVYPEAFIRLLGYMHLLFHLPYRQTEGFLKALRKFDSRIKVPDYSTIDRRVNKLNIDVCHFLSNSHDFFGYFYFSRRCPTKAFLKFLSA
ncbi:MAG: transposase, partial [Candidatus Bathyarchaeia archaeon]